MKAETALIGAAMMTNPGGWSSATTAYRHFSKQELDDMKENFHIYVRWNKGGSIRVTAKWKGICVGCGGEERAERGMPCNRQ